MKYLWQLAFMVLLSGCASYQMGHMKRALPGGYDRVAVPTFYNKTLETGAEVPFTNALIQELQRSGLAEVVSKNDAQVILEGTVSRVYWTGTQVGASDPDIQSAVYSPPGTSNPTGLPDSVLFTKEYQVYATVHLVARRTSDNTVMWESDIDGDKRYSGPLIFNSAINESNALYNSSARQQTLNKMALDMMSEAHDRLMENF